MIGLLRVYVVAQWVCHRRDGLIPFKKIGLDARKEWCRIGVNGRDL